MWHLKHITCFNGYYSALIATIYCLIYAIGDEFHQLFVDGRGGQTRDVLIDFAGALSGLGVRLLIHKLFCLCRKNKKI